MTHDLGASSVPAPSTKAGRREANAEEIRARCHVSSFKAPTISLRRLHGTDQVSLKNFVVGWLHI